MEASPEPPRMSRHLMTVVWPGFLVACLLELLVFAVVDPQELHWRGHPLMGSREAVYTLAFFVFWLLAMLSSALTAMLSTRLSGRPWD